MLLSAFVFSLLYLHPMFLFIFYFLSLLSSPLHCSPHWMFSCFYSIFILLSAFCLYFYPVLRAFSLWLCESVMGHKRSLVDRLVVRIPVSFRSLPAASKRRDAEVNTLEFSAQALYQYFRHQVECFDYHPVCQNRSIRGFWLLFLICFLVSDATCTAVGLL